MPDWRDALEFMPVGTHVKNDDLDVAVVLAVPSWATILVGKIMIQATVQNVRMTVDGATDPTATLGFQLRAGDPVVIIPITPGKTIIKVIEEAASGIVNYQFGR